VAGELRCGAARARWSCAVYLLRSGIIASSRDNKAARVEQLVADAVRLITEADELGLLLTASYLSMALDTVERELKGGRKPDPGVH
jgi:hypothetical protein